MSGNAFLDKSSKPTSPLLTKILGTRSRYLDELRLHVPGPVVEEWKYYGKTIGWTMKLLRGKRNLFFLVACDGFFAVAIVFGDKAVARVQKSDLPRELVQRLVDARKYVEGRGIRIEVKSRRALEHVKTLVDIKIAS